MSAAGLSAVPPASRRTLPALCAGLVVAGLAVSAWRPYDPTTWLLETVWVLVGLPVIVLAWRRFPLTGLLCALLAVHALVLALGGHYTYARVPLGEWAAEAYDTMKNLVVETVEADPELRVQERRTKFYSSLQKATRVFEELTFDDAQDFYEDDMVQRLQDLQQAIGSCITALRGARGNAGGAE